MEEDMNIIRSYLALFITLMVCLPAMAQRQYSNLPTFYINTENNVPIAIKEQWVNGTLTVVSSDPSETLLNVVTEIRGRGNSTWGFAKKPYRLKLDKRTNLLNLPAMEKNWVLLANHADKALIRNALAFKISELVGLNYTPPARFVDVVLNNQFLGNYMVTDQIEVKPYRVTVEEQEIYDMDEPAISGGYLLEIDGFAVSEPLYFTTDRGLPVTIKYPDDDKINSAQLNYIIRYIKDFENTLFSDNFTDEKLGYRAKVDTNTLINWYIGSELSGNPDSFWSTYIYKYRNNDKLYFGPLWDYDIAFNNDNRLGDAVEKLMLTDGHQYRFWIERICEDEWFLKAVDRRWKELINKGIEQQLIQYITDLSTLLDESQRLNFNLWPVLSQRIHYEAFLFNTYEEGIDFLKAYIQKRVAFLSDQFANPPMPSEPFTAENYYYTFYNKGNMHLIRVENNGLVLWDSGFENDDQEWRILPVDNRDVFQILNRRTGMAAASSRGGLGAQIILTAANVADNAQQWRFIPIKTGNLYGIINMATGYVIDNSGFQTNNGNPILEWTNYIVNQENQQWLIIKNDPVTGTVTMPESSLPIDVTFDIGAQSAYFRITCNRSTDVAVVIYHLSGRMVYRNIYTDLPTGENRIQTSLNKMNLPPGVYLIHAKTSDNRNAVKKIVIE